MDRLALGHRLGEAAAALTPGCQPGPSVKYDPIHKEAYPKVSGLLPEYKSSVFSFQSSYHISTVNHPRHF